MTATLDGKAWSPPGSISYTLSGPANFNTTPTSLAQFSNLPLGSYTLNFINGSPTNSSLTGILPCGVLTRGPTPCTQALTSAGLAFTLQFTSNPPTAGFTMSSGNQTATDGQTLNSTAVPSSPPTVSFDATARSIAFNGNTIINFTWRANGSIVGTTSKFSAVFPVGAYSITLVVTDSRNIVSMAAAGTIVITAGAPIWTQQSPVSSPSPRAWHALVYDQTHSQVVMFGGYATGGSTFPELNDTWVWDGTNWTQKFPVTSPPARFGHTLAYDTLRAQVVLFGGRTNPTGGPANSTLFQDTWVWDGTNWTQKFPAVSPPGRWSHGMVYDGQQGNSVLFAGTDLNFTFRSDTWVWDGTNWTQKFPVTTPPARSQSRFMAYDSIRGQVVVFGGIGQIFYNDTWVWDGTNWTQKFPVTSPPAMNGQSLAFHDLRQEVFLVGFPLPSAIVQGWNWDGSNWLEDALPPVPPSSGGPIAYDALRQELIILLEDGNGTFVLQ